MLGPDIIFISWLCATYHNNTLQENTGIWHDLFGKVLIPCQTCHENWHETKGSDKVVMIFGMITKS